MFHVKSQSPVQASSKPPLQPVSQPCPQPRHDGVCCLPSGGGNADTPGKSGKPCEGADAGNGIRGNKGNTIIAALRKAGPAILFLLPAACFLLYSVYVPFVWNAVLSFQHWDGFLQRDWAGLDNYVRAFGTQAFMHSLGNSVFLALATTLGAVCAGLFMALLVNKVTLGEGGVYRLVLFMPVMLPSAIVGLLFTFVYNYDIGMLNSVLRAVGLDSLAIAWLERPATVMWAISLVGMWKMAGLTMMLAFASIQMLPDSLFESAKMEGASYLSQIRHIIVPLVRPIISLSMIYTLVVNFKTYDLVFVMTRGGPGTVSQTVPLLMVKTAFQFNRFGYASAMGVVLTAAVMGITMVLNKLVKGEVHEY